MGASNPPTGDGEQGDVADGPRSEKDWHSEYTRLNHRYNALAENFKKAKDALQKRRQERDQWIQHAKLLERRIREAEVEYQIHILDQNIQQPGASSLPNGDDGGPRVSASTPEPNALTEARSINATRIGGRGGSDVTTATSRTASESSQNADEPDLPALPIQDKAPVKIKEEPSSDRAIFVEERSLRKRKLGEHAPEGSGYRRVKAEPSDNISSPIPAPLDFNFGGSDSIDLDDQSPAIATPKRHQDREQPVTDEDQRTEARLAGPTSVPNATAAHPGIHSSALTPIDFKGRLSLKPTPTERLDQSLRKGLGRGIAVLAEDGAVYAQPAQDSPSLTKMKTKNPGAKGRLDALLNTHYSEDDGKVGRPSPRGRSAPTVMNSGLAMPKPRDLPFDKNARATAERFDAPEPITPRPPLADATNTAHNRVQSAQTKKPRGLLRKKPVSELKLDDFKINPRLNDGHDFAFSEVVRNKDDRACLPGCVDMHCCGKEFRALALSQRPNPPLTAEQRQEEQKLLEEYLGDYCYRLAMMTKEERAEVWVEAKMRELANKYGRHRHRFSRMRSPPGFWNADFPNTQELQTNRAEAGKRERQQIQERYREAMRSDGRWLFRDE